MWIWVTESTLEAHKPRGCSLEGKLDSKTTTLAGYFLSDLIHSHLYLWRNLPTVDYKNLGSRNTNHLLTGCSLILYEIIYSG